LLQSHGMTPLVTLYHFVHPLWFEDLGGFLEADNIALFVAYSSVCFK
jgi:beta-glucosidase